MTEIMVGLFYFGALCILGVIACIAYKLCTVAFYKYAPKALIKVVDG